MNNGPRSGPALAAGLRHTASMVVRIVWWPLTQGVPAPCCRREAPEMLANKLEIVNVQQAAHHHARHPGSPALPAREPTRVRTAETCGRPCSTALNGLRGPAGSIGGGAWRQAAPGGPLQPDREPACVMATEACCSTCSTARNRLRGLAGSIGGGALEAGRTRGPLTPGGLRCWVAPAGHSSGWAPGCGAPLPGWRLSPRGDRAGRGQPPRTWNGPGASRRSSSRGTRPC